MAVGYEVHIIRDDRVNPGGEGVVEMPGEILFVVSAAGVTADGAEALQDCWRWFIYQGLWRYGEPGGRPIVTTYHLADIGEYAAQVRNRPGRVDCWCSPDHFCQGSVNGLQTAARASVRRGWRYYAPTHSEAVRAS